MYCVGESSSSPSRHAFLCESPIRDKHNRRILLLRSDKLPLSTSGAAGGVGDGSGVLDDGDDKLRGMVCELLGTLCDKDVLLYLHAGLASCDGGVTAWGARAFRRAVEFYYKQLASSSSSGNNPPLPGEVLALHVSFVSRAHAAVAVRFGGGPVTQLYQRLKYCDVLEDVEEHLGVDSTLLGLHAVDFEYDAVMRAWTGRNLDDPHHDLARMKRYNGTSADGSTDGSGSLKAFGIDDDEIHSQSFATPSSSTASIHFPIDPSKPLINVDDVSFDRDTTPLTTPAAAKKISSDFDPRRDVRMLEEP